MTTMLDLPTDWQADRLKDVAAINIDSLSAGTDPDYEFDYLEISNVDYYGVIDPAAIERVRFEDAPSRARRVIRKDCTIISSVRPNLQAVAQVQMDRSDLVCSTGFNVVQPHAHRLHPRFTYYVLISEDARQYFEATATGVGYPAVSDKDFNGFPVPLPEIAEQELIAAYLDASCADIDAAVAAKQKQIETLENVRSSTIEKAVTRGINEVSRRLVGQDWIDEIPEHWNVVRVKRLLARMDYGISVSTNDEGRYPVLKMGHIQNGEIVYTKLDFVDEVVDDLLLETSDLLYNRTNSPDQVGKAAIFRKMRADDVTFASYLVRLRVNHRVSAEYLNYVLNSNGFLGFARRLAVPSVQQSNLNSTRYGRMLVPLPPMEEQLIIVAKLNALSGDIKRTQAILQGQIDTLTAYRKSLIHECVTGQRRISAADLERVQGHAG